MKSILNKAQISQLLAVILLIFVLFSCQYKIAKGNSLKILLPLYVYPNWYEPESYAWSEVASAAQQVPIVAIINPNNGPDGNPPNRDYEKGLKELQQANITTIGYVYSLYGDRPLAEVEKDIDLYYQYFGVQGIFIDETASSKAKVDYYRRLYRYIKSKGNQNLVIINPGNDTDLGYITSPAADVSVIFENYSRVWSKYQAKPYVSRYPAERFGSLIHSVSSVSTMKSHIDKAAKSNIGYIYVTDKSPDDADKNPWNQLPVYWQEEVDYIQSLP